MNRANVSKKIVALVAIVMLVAILSVCLVACNQKDYEKRLKDEKYTVVSLSAEDLGVDKEDASIEWAVKGTKGSITSGIQTVTVIKFAKTDDAKEFADNLSEKLYTIKRSGKIVIYGTEQGVKDAQ